MIRKLAVFFAPLVLALGAQGGAVAEVADPQVQRVGADVLVVSWRDDDPVDVYVAERPDAGLAEARLVSDDDRDGRFEISAGPAARPYFLLQDTGDHAVVRVAERALPLEHGSNFRDIGGYPAADGKRVRWGRIFRSGATPLLTDADVARIRALGIHDLIDLRSSEERSLAPTRLEGVRYSAVGYPMSRISGKAPQAGAAGRDAYIRAVYREFPTLLAPQLRILFRTLIAGEGAVAYNCSAGQDRTGFATALILAALGTPREVILADYHLSTSLRRPEYEMPRLNPAAQPDNPVVAYFARFQQDPNGHKPRPLFDSDHRALLEFALAEVEGRWGSVEAYLDQELGVDAADIAALRAQYLE